MNPLTGKTYQFSEAPKEEVDRVLGLRFPPITESNRSLSEDEVLYRLTGRRVIWIPPEPTKATGPVPSASYGDAVPPLPGTTVAQYLRSVATGATEFGYPEQWMAAASGRPSTSIGAGFVDVVLVTDLYFAFVSIPR